MSTATLATGSVAAISMGGFGRFFAFFDAVDWVAVDWVADSPATNESCSDSSVTSPLRTATHQRGLCAPT